MDSEIVGTLSGGNSLKSSADWSKEIRRRCAHPEAVCYPDFDVR